VRAILNARRGWTPRRVRRDTATRRRVAWRGVGA